jgi:3-hydroxyisobutyrate dehydrogenase/2-hydroxy-3-oxopropionate reductase
MAIVAVVGIGVMGSRLATRLLRTGHTVLIWNRSPDKLSPLIELGARAVATPADAASGAQILITMVSDPVALRAVSEGSDGIAAGANAPLTVIEMSTVGLSAVERLASMLPRGTTLLDAPVLGSRAEAESGSLTIFVGGSAPSVARVMPVLHTFGSVIHVGELGAGNAAKLVANATLFGTLGVLGEVLALAEGLGLSDDLTYQVLAATPLAEQAERRRGAIEGGAYPARFRLALARKDAALIRDAAVASGVDLRLGKAAETWLVDADTAGLGGLDYTAMLAMILFRGHRRQSRYPIGADDALPGSGP